MGVANLRATLAFWKSQGKTIIVSEHRLYYLRGLADRFIYIAAGKVKKDYSAAEFECLTEQQRDRKSTRLNSSHVSISYAVFCLKKKNPRHHSRNQRRL